MPLLVAMFSGGIWTLATAIRFNHPVMTLKSWPLVMAFRVADMAYLMLWFAPSMAILAWFLRQSIVSSAAVQGENQCGHSGVGGLNL
jgi:ABC-type enterochelin transport system permease subunit